jgi:hypothetical protein
MAEPPPSPGAGNATAAANEAAMPAALPEGAFSGRQAFRDILLAAFDAAAREHWRELILSDADFADWPMGERVVIDAFQAWAGRGRQLVLLAERFDRFERHHPRFVQWRQLWSHIIDCRVCHGPGLPRVPSAISAPTWAMQRLDAEHFRGVADSDPVRRRALREQIDECLRHSRPGFAAHTLGL